MAAKRMVKEDPNFRKNSYGQGPKLNSKQEPKSTSLAKNQKGPLTNNLVNPLQGNKNQNMMGNLANKRGPEQYPDPYRQLVPPQGFNRSQSEQYGMLGKKEVQMQVQTPPYYQNNKNNYSNGRQTMNSNGRPNQMNSNMNQS